VIEGPLSTAGLPVWRATLGDLHLRFSGRGAARSTEETVAALVPGIGVAWPRQVHSSKVVAATVAGCCGEGDGVLIDRPGLAAAVVTADCVPILLADRRPSGRLAAVHAGWRGLLAGVLPAALARLSGEPDSMWACIGPAIGPCCYEVGEDVARRFAAAGLAEAVVRRPVARLDKEKPRLDLWRAAAIQLQLAGVRAIETCRTCTRCDERLWSARRDGAGAGRNVAFIWREAGATTRA